MGHEPCACGSVTPRIRHLAGRNLCRFKLPEGSSYNPFDAYGELLWRLPLVQFQMIQEDGGRITLRYRSHEDIGTLELTRELEGKVRAVHGATTSLELRRVERFEVDVAKFHSFLSRC